MNRPEWLRRTDSLIPALLGYFQDNLQDIPHISDQHLSMMPYCAALHWYSALESSIDVNLRGHHAVALCLVRQCLEAQSVITLGLFNSRGTEHMLQRWASGTATHGQIRQYLEHEVWPSFGHRGLWGEPWADYYASINKAVHDYAHYTPTLMGWQWRDVGPSDEPLARMMAIGVAAYDKIKASRITAFHSVIALTMGLVLTEFTLADSDAEAQLVKDVSLLQQSLSNCSLLWPKSNWEAQFAPHMFVPGGDSDSLLS